MAKPRVLLLEEPSRGLSPVLSGDFPNDAALIAKVDDIVGGENARQGASHCSGAKSWRMVGLNAGSAAELLGNPKIMRLIWERRSSVAVYGLWYPAGHGN